MEDHAVGGQVVVFDALALLVPVIGGDHIATKRDPVLKSVELLTLVHGSVNGGAEFRFAEVAQQKGCTDRTAQFAEGEVESVATAARASQALEDGREEDAPGLDADADPQQVVVVLLYQLSVNRLSEQFVDMVVLGGLVRPVQHQTLPVADSGHQVDAQQVGDGEDRCALPVGVGVHGGRLKITVVAQQTIEDVPRLVDPAGDEVAVERDVAVRDVVIPDAAVPSIAQVVLSQQVLLVDVLFGAVRRRPFSGAPDAGQGQLGVGVDHPRDRLIKGLLGNVPPVDPFQLLAVGSGQGARRLARLKVAAVTEDGRDVAGAGGSSLESKPESGPKGRVMPVPRSAATKASRMAVSLRVSFALTTSSRFFRSGWGGFFLILATTGSPF